jgi:DNA-binding CsgD family transcriptional regulator
MVKLIEDPSVLRNVVEDHGISKREEEIMKLLLEGKSNKEIETSLFISYHTVKNHVYNLYQKLGVKSRYELLHLIAKYEKKRSD